MKTFLKLLKKELTQNIGFAALAFLYIIFIRLITFIATMSNTIDDYNRYHLPTSQTPTEAAAQLLGSASLFHIFCVISLACLFSLLCAHYLHGKKTVDFYHSLPVKKTTVFGVKYLSGIIIFAVSYSINYVFMLIACLSMGVFSAAGAISGLIALISGILGYILIYSVCVLAGLLTASIITHIVLGFIFMGIIPLIITLWDGWFSFFYLTYISNIEPSVYLRTSPITYFYTVSQNTGLFGIASLGIAAAVFEIVSLGIAAAVFTVINIFVCKIRPSEATETALAFKKLNSPLRVIFSILCGAVGAFAADSMFNAEGATVFTIGFFTVLIISSIVIEVIFSFDFAAAFKRKRCLVISVLIGAVMIGASLMTIKGYNTYSPDAGKIAEAAFSISNIENDENFRKPLDTIPDYYFDETENYNGEPAYDWTSARDSVFENMSVTDSDLAAEVIASCASEYENAYFKSPSAADENGYTVEAEADGGEAELIAKEPTEPGEQLYYNISLKCTLKNGRTFYRNYDLKFAENRELLARLVDTEEYKKGLYNNIFNLDPASIRAVNFDNAAFYGNPETLNISKEQSEKLVSALKTDLLTVNLDMFTNECPKFNITLYTKNYDVNTSLYLFNAASAYIYEGFSNTLSVLEEIGFKNYTDDEIINRITSVNFSRYPLENRYDVSETTSYTTSEEISQIFPALMPYNLTRMIYDNGNIDANIFTINSRSSSDYYNAFVKSPDLLPDFVKTDLKLN